MSVLLFLAGLLFSLISNVRSHGFLCFPPSRNAAWRCGFPQDEPKNYDEMALNAGGVRTTYPNYPDACPVLYGVCGDPFYSKNHAAGGIHDRGVRPGNSFVAGQTIDVVVNITAYHKGEFYLQLCNTYPETEACFQTISNYSIENTAEEGSQPSYVIPFTFPSDFSCERCVFRWFWITNNSPGLPAEFFINCADISVQ